MNRNRDLAVGFLSQRPTVLSLHTDRAGALFGKGNIINDENTARTGERFGEDQAVASQDTAFVPRALVDELLQSLVWVTTRQRGGQGHAPGEGFDTLAFAIQ